MSTFGTDPCFRRVRGVLSAASSPKDSLCWKQVGSKCAEQRAECSFGPMTPDELSPQSP